MPTRTYQGESELRGELVRYCRWLARLGFTPGTAGNLSVRLDDERLLTTPTGMSKALVKSADMVTVDPEGRLLAGTRRVTSEIAMHVAIYQHREDVCAVVHAHPPIATAFACAGHALDEMLCQEAVMSLGVVPLARYATTGTSEVVASLVPYLQDHSAVLMANHGAVTYGPSLQDAFYKMETLEHLANIRLTAHQLGTPQVLRLEQVEQLRRAKANYVLNAGGEGS